MKKETMKKTQTLRKHKMLKPAIEIVTMNVRAKSQ